MSIGQSDLVHLDDHNLRFIRRRRRPDSIREPARSNIGLLRLLKGLAAEGVSSKITLLSVTPPVLGSNPHQQSPL